MLLFYRVFLMSLSLSFIQESMAGNFYYDFSEQDFSENTVTKIEKVQCDLKEKEAEIKAIGLSKNHITSDIFTKFTNKVNPSLYKNLKVLDLGDNYLDEKVSPYLAQWLQLESKPIINLEGNKVSLKHIKGLYTSFKENGFENQVSEFMNRIIFMSKDYVNKAKNHVMVYKNLEDQNIIPKTWDNLHREFYDSLDYKKLILTREQNKRLDTITNMKMVAMSSPSKSNILHFDLPPNEEDRLPDSAVIKTLANLSINQQPSQEE